MDLHLPSHHWEHRLPDWAAAAVSGFVAGAALMVVDLLWSALVSGESPWRTSHLIAAIVLGPNALASSEFGLGVVTAALLTHYALGIAFGLLLAFILAGFHWDSSLGMTALVGAVFGLVLYAVNFHVMTQIFAWFTELRGWPTLAAHLLFGTLAALLYLRLNRRGEGH
jgi:uncharacterized membrane protein